MAQPLLQDIETAERTINLIGSTVTVGVQSSEKFLSGQLWTVHLHEAGGSGMGQGGTLAGAIQSIRAVGAKAA